MSFEDIYSADLLNKKKETVKGEDALRGKLILLYFSAHWCPPCRSFTPKLADWYNDMAKQKKKIACVFVSSDRDEAAMWSYFDKDHGDYYCLPHGHPLKDVLATKYKVSGIPTLVVVQEDGTTITDKARGDVDAQTPDIFDKWFAEKK